MSPDTISVLSAVFGGGALAIGGAIKWATSVLITRIDKFDDKNDAQHAANRIALDTFSADIHQQTKQLEVRVTRLEDHVIN